MSTSNQDQKIQSSKFSIPPLDTRACYKPWIITLRILKANNFKAADSVIQSMARGTGVLGASSDPAVFMEVDGCVARTSVVDQNLNPVWNDEQVFEFYSLGLQEDINLSVYDWNENGKFDFLGMASVKLYDFPLSELTPLTLVLKDTNGVEGYYGTLSIDVTVGANFSLGDEPSQLFFFKQIRDFADEDSFLRFASHESMCILLDRKLDKVVSKVNSEKSSEVLKALSAMSLQDTLDGIKAIVEHCGKSLDMAMHAYTHAPNVDNVLTLILNTHYARAISELNRWCYKRLDTTAVLIGPHFVQGRPSGAKSTPLGKILPELVYFLSDSGDLNQEHVESSCRGLFEEVLCSRFGNIFDHSQCNFFVSFRYKDQSQNIIQSAKLSNVFNVQSLISEEVNQRCGQFGKLRSMFFNIGSPYENVINHLDDNQLNLSAGGVIALVCGSKGWGGLSSDWATDCLQLMESQIKFARECFSQSQDTSSSLAAPSKDSLASVRGLSVNKQEAYSILMLAYFQIVAHSMDALIYRFLHMFKRLRYFEDVESNKKISTEEDHAVADVPDEEVHIILNCVCNYIKDAYRVKEQVEKQFTDPFLGSKLKLLSERLWCSLDALELAAVSQLSYLVLKCFSSVFASHRILSGIEKENNDFGKFVDFTKRAKSVQTVQSKLACSFHLLVNQFEKGGRQVSKTKLAKESVNWPQICIEICDILNNTLPVLEEKLSENDDEHFMARVKSLICESLVIKIFNFFVSALLKMQGKYEAGFNITQLGKNFKNTITKSGSLSQDDIHSQCVSFQLCMNYLRNELVGRKTDEDDDSFLKNGYWRAYLDWIDLVGWMLAERTMEGVKSRHNEICKEHSLPREGIMLDLTIFLCTEIRGESTSTLKSVFKHHLSASSGIGLTSFMNPFSQSQHQNEGSSSQGTDSRQTLITSTSSIDMELVVAAKGVNGLIDLLVKQRRVKPASKVLGGSNSSNALNTINSLFANTTTLKTKAAATIDPLSSTEEGTEATAASEKQNPSETIGAMNLKVEVVSAMNLFNLDEKSGTMSSPYVRCSLLHDYHRDNYRKNNSLKKSSIITAQLNGMMTMIGEKISSTVNAATSGADAGGSTTGVSDTSIASNSSQNSSNINQDQFIDQFETEAIPNNLNPVWSKTNLSSNSTAAVFLSGTSSTTSSTALDTTKTPLLSRKGHVSTFRIDKEQYMFWGLVLEVDVLSNNVLIGTALIDLMEWDESSAGRARSESWYPLYHHESVGQKGSICLHMQASK